MLKLWKCLEILKNNRSFARIYKKIKKMNELKDINLVARYIALSLLTKQMTVSPLKLQNYCIIHRHGAWCSLDVNINCLPMFHKHGSMVLFILRFIMYGRIEICVSIFCQRTLGQQRLG